MIINKGSVTNSKTGVTKDITIKTVNANTLKEMFIGLFIVAVGITYLTDAAFKNGVNAFEKAEFKALSDAGII